MLIKFNIDSRRHPSNIAITSKTERQELSLLKWRDARGLGILHIVPRFGKTRIGVMAIDKVVKASPNASVEVIVPNVIVKQQWLLAIKEYNLKLANNVRVRTKQQWVNADINCDLIIYDEIHKFVTTPSSTDKLKKETVKFKLGLTGTLPTITTELTNLLEVLPVIDTVDEEEAIRNGWLNDYAEYNLALDMSYHDKIRYAKFSDYITETLQLFNNTAVLMNSNIEGAYFKFDSDYSVLIGALAGKKDLLSGKYVQADDIRRLISAVKDWSVDLNLNTAIGKSTDKYWSPYAVRTRAITFDDFVRKRKILINSGDEKLSRILELVSNKPNTESLIYVGNIDFAEEVTTAINNILGNNTAICFHSKVASKPVRNLATGEYITYKSGAKKGLPKILGAKRLKEHYVEGIKQGKYKILVVVDSLNEGLNIPNLKRTIMAAGSRNTTVYQQRAARSKTIDPNDANKEAEVINLYYDDFDKDGDTYRNVDKQKLILRQKANKSNPIHLVFDTYINGE